MKCSTDAGSSSACRMSEAFYLLSYDLRRPLKSGLGSSPGLTTLTKLEVAFAHPFAVEMMAFSKETLIIYPVNIVVLGVITVVNNRMKEEFHTI